MKNRTYLRMMSRWYGQVPITITLATAIGTLVLVAVGVVFGVGVWLAQKNTFDLLRFNAEQSVVADVSQFTQHLRPAEHLTRFLAQQIGDAHIDTSNTSTLGSLLTGALAGAQQIEAILYIDVDQTAHIARRNRETGKVDLVEIDSSERSINRLNLDDFRQGPRWGAPVWREDFQKTYLNRFHPVTQDGNFIGAVGAVTSIEGLSNFIDQHGVRTEGNSFILYGRDQVLAHWSLIDGYPGRSTEHPLPMLDTFVDPVLASIWQTEGRREMPQAEPQEISSHFMELFNERFAFVYRSVEGFGPEPMIIGAYFQSNDSIKEIQRMSAALIAGIATLFISLLAAIFLGHRIAQPIVRFSAAAARIRDLDVSRIEQLPGSVFRELNDQSIAFNSMLRALRWFELYVPKKLVERLIRNAGDDGTSSGAREVTVMFTDIVGFSSMSEGMSAKDVADFVNHHFSLVADCIESEQGTIDKFIGDAVMAFWGAPETQEDSAEKACRAALAIAGSIHRDNLQRQANGEPPVAIRIGIHTGIATVGNIGAPGRLNYTLIGDSVNIGQRLEQLGKKLSPAGTEVSVLISSETQRRLGADFTAVSAGKQKLRGRSKTIEVYRLPFDAGDSSD
ncbi:adenylate/guanylate cyclase domain-containing protein [Granulosicoccus sp. 3-233]|uniref:adenylate/guanylate cyclase domain-containing protein n=1 Tax=Granulosicoccus sp. 3-233 TaxID=3417969 RepID=UPI003D349B42